MEKQFFIRNVKSNKVYCSKCGKIQLQDRYNYMKHIGECEKAFHGYKTDTYGDKADKNDYKPLIEGVDYGYYLKAVDSDNALELTIGRPALVKRPGFSDRYVGAKWNPCVCVRFIRDSKEIKIMRYDDSEDLEIWLKRIHAGKLFKIHQETNVEVIRTVFPVVTDVYSLEMFAHIYQNRGLNYRKVLPDRLEKKLFTEIPEITTGLTGEKKSMFASLHKYKEDLILRLVINIEEKPYVFLFSKNYYATNRYMNMIELSKIEYEVPDQCKYAVKKFALRYPEMMILQYWEKSDHILNVLMAGTYHYGMELLAKAGITGITEKMHELDMMNYEPTRYRNVKTLTGFPLHLLLKLDRDLDDYYWLQFLEIEYARNPEFFQLDHFSLSQIVFLVEPIYLPRGKWLTYNEKMRILKYLSDKTTFQANCFRDYLYAYFQVDGKEAGFTLTPKDPVDAHNRIMRLVFERKNYMLMQNFISHVRNDEYQRLTTEWEEDKEDFEEDTYCIITPSHPEDLSRESSKMHNCVKLYTERVAEGETKIYFLRRKKDIDKSLGTIEVSANGRKLIQAKGFANCKLKEKERKFVYKWCKVKGIKIATYDLRTG